MFYDYDVDSKEKYQYGIYIQVGSAVPYVKELPAINNLFGVYKYIGEIEKRHNRYRQAFFIDNDFYNNKFTLESGGGTYYRFVRRKILEWETLENESKYEKCNNIISFFKYKA